MDVPYFDHRVATFCKLLIFPIIIIIIILRLRIHNCRLLRLCILIFSRFQKVYSFFIEYAAETPPTFWTFTRVVLENLGKWQWGHGTHTCWKLPLSYAKVGFVIQAGTGTSQKMTLGQFIRKPQPLIKKLRPVTV